MQIFQLAEGDCENVHLNLKEYFNRSISTEKLTGAVFGVDRCSNQVRVILHCPCSSPIALWTARCPAIETIMDDMENVAVAIVDFLQAPYIDPNPDVPELLPDDSNPDGDNGASDSTGGEPNGSLRVPNRMGMRRR